MPSAEDFRTGQRIGMAGDGDMPIALRNLGRVVSVEEMTEPPPDPDMVPVIWHGDTPNWEYPEDIEVVPDA